MDSLIEQLIAVTPSIRQVEWQRLEFTAFFHYGINSFTDREWGDGNEDIAIFDPKKLDTDQWCESISTAGIRGCIITAKHHDGFCIWDTAYSKHSVMYTPCKRDIVAELSKSCKKYDIKLGVYLSPWDRHEKTYGQGEAYDDYFCNQLIELLTKYGELYTVWFDGACGEGENGKKQIYNWDRYYSLIRKLQPNAVISSSGPDVRWCGNEAGDCRESEWSVVSEELFSHSEIAKVSQTENSTEFRRKCLEPQDKDLGSRNILKDAKKLIWYPSEVDTSIRPGWFYHETEDTSVRSLDELTNIYLKSVGGNSVLLLNIPPHKDGYITRYDTKRLKEIGDFIRNTFSDNLAEDASIVSDSLCKEHVTASVLRNKEEFWQPDTQELPAILEIKLDMEESIHYCVLMERIQLSQRVEHFFIEALDSLGIWQVIYEGTIIGYKKICRFSPVFTQNIRIRIMESRKNPAIQFVGLYR